MCLKQILTAKFSLYWKTESITQYYLGKEK